MIKKGERYEGKSKILLVFPPTKNVKNYKYAFPLGLAYISAILKHAKFNVDCVNLQHYDGTIEEQMDYCLNQEKYDHVMTGGVIFDYKAIQKIIDSAHAHKSRPITTVGGIIVTAEPEVMQDIIKPDFIVIGEGEETIVDLVNCLDQKGNPRNVKGILFYDKTAKELVRTERRPDIPELSDLPIPDLDGFEFNKTLDKTYTNQNYMTQFFDHPRVYPIIGSRGCPFDCTFCYHYGAFRKRSIPELMSEIRTAVKLFKINVVQMYDDCIALNRARLVEFCEEMKKLRSEIDWDLRWAPQLIINKIEPDMLKLMKEAGVWSVSYGFETFSQKVLRSMHKSITPVMIEKAFFDTLEVGISVQANFIFGDIAETVESYKETLAWWRKNSQGQINLGLIKPYPGAKIYDHAVRKGLIPDKADFIKNHIGDSPPNMTENMTDEEFAQMKKEVNEAIRDDYVKVVPSYIKKVQENTYNLKVKCPFCKDNQNYNNCYITNRMTYSFNMACRNCGHRYFIVSQIKNWGYNYYPVARVLRDAQLGIIKQFNRGYRQVK
jgi:anaerobic magnesium-protoporphyrin IX monomethyl ester cyclase